MGNHDLGTIELDTDNTERGDDVTTASVHDDDVPVSWSTRLNKFDKNETPGAGGAWIFQELCRFADNFIATVEREGGADYKAMMMTEFILTMAYAVGGRAYTHSRDKYYDHRFLYEESTSGVLLPMCGYVRKALSRLLRRVAGIEEMNLTQQDKAYVDSVLMKMKANASV